MNRTVETWLNQKPQQWIKAIYERNPGRAVAVVNDDDTVNAAQTRKLHDELELIGYRTIPTTYHSLAVKQLESIGRNVSVRRDPFTNQPALSDNPWSKLPEAAFVFLLFLQEINEVPSTGMPTPMKNQLRRSLEQDLSQDEDYSELWQRYLAAQKQTIRKTDDQKALERAQDRVYWTEEGGGSSSQFPKGGDRNDRPQERRQEPTARSYQGSATNAVEIKHYLISRYSLDELRLLVEDLAIEGFRKDTIGGDRDMYALNLVTWVERRGFLPVLVAAIGGSISNSGPRSSDQPFQESDTLLANVIAQFFDNSDVRSLCFQLGIDYEDLVGENKKIKVQSLVQHFVNRGDTAPLTKLVLQERPNVRDILFPRGGRQINTGGGSYIGGNISVGGDFTGGNKYGK